MAVIPSLDDNSLQAICDVVGDTGAGLTGSEIGRLLSQQNIPDPEPMITKRHRLFTALRAKQLKDGCANNVLAFIQAVIDPIRYTSNLALFECRRSELNTILILRGYEIQGNGKIAKVTQAQTLSEAHKRARNLHTKLSERKVHPEVLKFCQAELVADNFFMQFLKLQKALRIGLEK